MGASTTTVNNSNNLRIVAAGRGLTMSDPKLVECVLDMVDDSANNNKVVYLGTATFDEKEPMERQCRGFREAGCEIVPIRVSERVEQLPSLQHIKATIQQASVLLVSGGNTLYAVSRWKELGMDKLIRQASENGAVLCGGSAGAICWFHEGHSQSMNPALALNVDTLLTEEERRDWEYVRVKGLGFLPGLCVPHHDVEQSNGIPRELDSNEMMKDKPNQPCLGIDEGAALVVEGDQARVVSASEDAACYVKVCKEGDECSSDVEIEKFPFTEDHGPVPIDQLLTDPASILDSSSDDEEESQ